MESTGINEVSGNLTGRHLGRYEVGELLGQGGMGEVYRGRDSTLDREVAIKVLRYDEGKEHSPSRFEREARLAARLNHPNIVELYDFGLAAGRPYAVLELLQGESLRERLRARGLSVAEAVEIGAAIASGLAAAHEAGVVHRDIKPGNVFLTVDGRVKILDFGIALPPVDEPTTPEQDTESLTAPGVVVGTTPYMSPEQVRGQNVDKRSDIFSLGCVIYEMIVGLSPFARESSNETLAAILTEDPLVPSSLHKGTPAVVDQIVARCLRKEAGARFDSARDVAFALQAALGTDPSTSAARSADSRMRRRRWLKAVGLLLVALLLVAAGWFVQRSWMEAELPANRRLMVMGFSAPEDDPELLRMAAGLSRSLTWKISLLEREGDGLDWILSSSKSARHSRDGLQLLRDEFGLSLVVKGRLESAGGRLRLHLQLCDAARGVCLRRKVVESEAGNPGAMQVDPVLAVAEMLDMTAGAAANDRLRLAMTNVTAAWSAFLDGSGMMALDDRERWQKGAVPRLRQAVDEDPLFAEARLELARAYLAGFRATGQQELMGLALDEVALAAQQQGLEAEASLVAAALHRAVGDEAGSLDALAAGALADRDHAELLLQLGRALTRAARHDEAEAALRRSIYLRPGYWPGHHWLAELEVQRGNYEAAATEFLRITELVPAYAGGYTALAVPLLHLGRREQARTALEHSLRLKPDNNFVACSNLGSLYFYEARFADAAAMYERAVELQPGDHRLWGNLGWALIAADEKARAEAAFLQAIDVAVQERNARPDDVELAVDLAGYCGAAGQRDAGRAVLQATVLTATADPELVARVAETYEDLGDRERALEWAARALRMGVGRERFTKHPSMRDLAADPRFGAASG